jgi:hypothetical protein
MNLFLAKKRSKRPIVAQDPDHSMQYCEPAQPEDGKAGCGKRRTSEKTPLIQVGGVYRKFSTASRDREKSALNDCIMAVS